MVKNKDDSPIAARFRLLVAEHLNKDLGEVRNYMSFVDDLGADSLDTIELVMAAEEEFQIDIPDADSEKIRTTVGDAIAYLESRKDVK